MEAPGTEHISSVFLQFSTQNLIRYTAELLYDIVGSCSILYRQKSIIALCVRLQRRNDNTDDGAHPEVVSLRLLQFAKFKFTFFQLIFCYNSCQRANVMEQRSGWWQMRDRNAIPNTNDD